MHTRSSSHSRTCTMSCDQSFSFPQVFLVDGGGGAQHFAQAPGPVPYWSFPPAQEKVRSRGKSRGFMGVSPSLATAALLLFLLVFAALGFEAYQIHNMQKQLRKMREGEPVAEVNIAQRQIGFNKPEWQEEDKDNRPAAHVTGRIETKEIHDTLRWDPKARPAFVSGGVVYRIEDGSLQVNQSGLYYIYSRVELIFKSCSLKSSFIHTLFVRREGHPSPLTLMEAHRAGFCSEELKHSWTSESFLGSALKLQKNDRVFVNVSHPFYLTHAHYANFFGLYKI